MKLLIVLPGDKLAGAEKVLNSLASEFYRMGWAVYVIIWHVDKDKTKQWDSFKKKYTIYEINSNSLIGMLQLGKLISRLTTENNIDITISSNIILNSLLGMFRMFNLLKTNKLIAREPSSPFLRYSNSIKLLKYKFIYFIGYRSQDYIIFQTNLMKNVFLENVRGDFCSGVFPNPLDYNEISTLASLPKEIEDNLYGNYIVAAGRFINEKGFDLLLKSFATIKDKKIKLLILGSGPLEAELKRLTSELKIEGKVLFLGFVRNPMNYFKCARICVISSRVEGFPNTLLQMLSVNENVITTNCCGDLNDIPGIQIVSFDISEMANMINLTLANEQINDVLRNDVERYLLNRNSASYIKELLKKINYERI